MPIPQVLAYPIDTMHGVANQIIADAQTLESDAAPPISQMKQVAGNLPSSMQADLRDFVTALDRGTTQMVAARVTVGNRLNASATSGASADTSGAVAFRGLLA